MHDIYVKKILGNVKANMYVIEFQKRGLPHAHILIIMEDDSKPRCSEDYDLIVSAEIPDKLKYSQAWATVTTSMIHGPCGKLYPKSPCMVDGKCSKEYPKDFLEYTIDSEDGYPQYRKRDNGVDFTKKSGTIIDNRWVVPHNLYLTTKYNCHINVEICSSV